MATETEPTRDGFGEVSQIRGLVFEYLSLAASVVGILSLALLLVYVTVDAFDLSSASEEWFLVYFLTLVLPTFGFLLYSARETGVPRRALLGLVGGLLAVFGLFQALAAVGATVPRLSWPLAYLFVVVVPLVGYVGYVAAQRPVGAVGVGLLGRILGGFGAAVAVTSVFVIFDVYLWFLVFTLGLAPAVAIYAFARIQRYGSVAYLSIPVALVAFAASVPLRNALVVFPSSWLIYAFTLGIPIGLLAAAFLARRRSTRTAALGGLAAPVGAWAVGFAALNAGLHDDAAVLLFLTVVVPSGVYTDRILQRGRARIGLVFPFLLVAGALAGAFLVDLWAVTGPDPWLDWAYVTSAPSRTAADAGLYPAIIGSIFVITLVAILSFALGVGTAVFLEDYTSDTGPIGSVTRLIQVNISNLAGVPSVVYGLLGLGLFVNLLGLGFGTVVVASITLSLLILPIVIISAQEAIRSVPDEMREASYGMGATRWQTTKNVVLPEALPGILTGTILSLGRAIGETAPLIMIGAPTTVFNPPGGLFSRVSAMPMQIYAWADFPQAEFRYGVVAAGVVTLLVVLIGLNATAILVRNRYERSDS